MNSIEYLYIVASEECSEMQQCISKILRFGEANHHPDRPQDTNAKELLTEYYQLQCVMEMLIDNGVLCNISENEIKEIKSRKRQKISDYAQLSKSLGLLN